VNLEGLFAGADRARAMTAFAGERFDSLNSALRVWPHLYDSEGFFVAALTKLPADESLHPRKFQRSRRCDDFALNTNERRMIDDFLWSEWNFVIPEGFTVIKRQSEKQRIDYWLIPEAGLALLSAMPLQRPGIRLLEAHGKKLVFEHDAASAFGKDLSGSRVLELDLPNARRYLKKHDLDLTAADGGESGQYLLRFQGLPLGIAKALSGTLKNMLPPASAGDYF
jgi:16S rRNA (cytosine1407-C5)-methyltransferase